MSQISATRSFKLKKVKRIKDCEVHEANRDSRPRGIEILDIFEYEGLPFHRNITRPFEVENA